MIFHVVDLFVMLSSSAPHVLLHTGVGFFMLSVIRCFVKGGRTGASFPCMLFLCMLSSIRVVPSCVVTSHVIVAHIMWMRRRLESQVIVTNSHRLDSFLDSLVLTTHVYCREWLFRYLVVCKMSFVNWILSFRETSSVVSLFRFCVKVDDSSRHVFLFFFNCDGRDRTWVPLRVWISSLLGNVQRLDPLECNMWSFVSDLTAVLNEIITMRRWSLKVLVVCRTTRLDVCDFKLLISWSCRSLSSRCYVTRTSWLLFRCSVSLMLCILVTSIIPWHSILYGVDNLSPFHLVVDVRLMLLLEIVLFSCSFSTALIIEFFTFS